MFRFIMVFTLIALVTSGGCGSTAKNSAPIAQAPARNETSDPFEEATQGAKASKDARDATMEYVKEHEGWLRIFNRVSR